MSTGLEVRLATPDEYEAVGQITLDAYVADGFLTPGDGYAAHLRNAADRADKAELFVAAAGGEVLGTVTFCPPGSSYREVSRPDQGEFRMLAVSPAARGRGIAKELVARCFDRCRDFGFDDLVLCSMVTMTSAHALYTRFGFTRAPSLDFSPEPDVWLLAFVAPVPAC